MSRIHFESVSKRFGDEQVLDSFSAEVPSSEMRVILGGSGSGKSTILKMVAGLVRPDSGQVFVGDQNLNELDEEELMPIRARIGMVFQAGALFDSLTVGDNVSYRLREQKKLSDEEVRETVLEVLGFVGLAHAVDKMPAELSGGMKRRVAIARAIVGHPEIMLYDEPTAGLDPITARTICELIMKLRDIEKATSIFVTHDLSAAFTMARERAREGQDGRTEFVETGGETPENTRFLVLHEGRVLTEGSYSDLEQTDDKFIREFLD